jgi:hypothetical protein
MSIYVFTNKKTRFYCWKWFALDSVILFFIRMNWFRQGTHCILLGILIGLMANEGAFGMLYAQTAKEQAGAPQMGMMTLLARPELGGGALGGGPYKIGEIVEILAIPAPHYRFVRWEGEVTQVMLPRTRVVTMGATTLATAVFEPERYRLHVTCEPAYTGRVEGDGWLSYGVTAPVRATPAKGYGFSHWEGPVAAPHAADTTLANPLIGPVKLKAHFKRMVDSRTLMVIAEPALGGEVTGGGSYEPGTVVKLTAKPARGFVFNGWRGAVSSPGASVTEILVAQDATVKAIFVPQRAVVHAKIMPEGAGKVTGDLGIRPCFVPAILKAEAMPGYAFDGWEGAVSVASGDQTSVTPQEAGKVIVITARFKPAP